MARWSLAPSLEAMRAEANREAPDRSKASDGTLGDQAHKLRKSDHNIGARNLVHALDLTHDPEAGFDAHARVERLAEAGDERISYLISKRRIWNPTSAAWAVYSRLRAEGATRREAARAALPGWRAYTGPNPHDKHAHISVKSTPPAENDRSPWWPPEPVKVKTATAAPPKPEPVRPPPAVRRTGGAEGMRVDTLEAAWEKLDAQGRGYVDVPVPFLRVVGIIPQGSNPGKTGEGYWPPIIFAAQGVGEITRITLTGLPEQGGMVYVKVLADE